MDLNKIRKLLAQSPVLKFPYGRADRVETPEPRRMPPLPNARRTPLAESEQSVDQYDINDMLTPHPPANQPEGISEPEDEFSSDELEAIMGRLAGARAASKRKSFTPRAPGQPIREIDVRGTHSGVQYGPMTEAEALSIPSSPQEERETGRKEKAHAASLEDLRLLIGSDLQKRLSRRGPLATAKDLADEAALARTEADLPGGIAGLRDIIGEGEDPEAASEWGEEDEGIEAPMPTPETAGEETRRIRKVKGVKRYTKNLPGSEAELVRAFIEANPRIMREHLEEVNADKRGRTAQFDVLKRRAEEERSPLIPEKQTNIFDPDQYGPSDDEEVEDSEVGEGTEPEFNLKGTGEYSERLKHVSIGGGGDKSKTSVRYKGEGRQHGPTGRRWNLDIPVSAKRKEEFREEHKDLSPNKLKEALSKLGGRIHLTKYADRKSTPKPIRAEALESRMKKHELPEAGGVTTRSGSYESLGDTIAAIRGAKGNTKLDKVQKVVPPRKNKVGGVEEEAYGAGGRASRKAKLRKDRNLQKLEDEGY